jgi:hypothetical protein
MSAGTTRLPIRLAIRKEGDFVNAYLAAADTMDGATLLGSIRTTLAEHGDVFQIWKKSMSDAFSVLVRETLGQEPQMHEQRAPEHERSGHG